MRTLIAGAALLFAAVGTAFGQAAAPPSLPSFEVASVKLLADMPMNNWLITRSGGRLRWNTTLMGVVMYAYHLQAYQISGMPKGPVSWYAFDAETDPAATEDQIRLMFQSLLASRFKIAVHRESRELNGYTLTVAKNGPKIKPVSDGDKKPAPLPPWFQAKGDAMAAAIEGKILVTMEGRGINAVTGRRISMAQLAGQLEQEMRTFVLDKTGMAGKYYFGFKCQQINGSMDADADVPVGTIFQALQEELGLKLEKEKGPVEVMIVDHLETVPTEN